MRQESSHRKQWLTLAVRGGMNRSGNDLRMRVPNKTSGTKPQQFGFRRFQKHWASRRKARGGWLRDTPLNGNLALWKSRV